MIELKHIFVRIFKNKIGLFKILYFHHSRFLQAITDMLKHLILKMLTQSSHIIEEIKLYDNFHNNNETYILVSISVIS